MNSRYEELTRTLVEEQEKFHQRFADYVRAEAEAAQKTLAAYKEFRVAITRALKALEEM